MALTGPGGFPKLPEQLLEAIDRGQAVGFIGSGFSQRAGLPSWLDLLRGLVERGEQKGLPASDCRQLHELLDAERFLLVAEELGEYLGKPAIQRYLQTKIRRVNAKPVSAHKVITRVPFSSVITTNYDTLLESAFTVAERGESPPTFTQLDLKDLSVSLKSEFYILKLHGTIDRVESLVFSAADYREIAHKNPGCTKHLETVFATKTVLFLAYGFRDPDLALLLGRLRTLGGYASGDHFAILDCTKVSDAEQRHLTREFGVHVIPYHPSDATHLELDSLLVQLTDGAQPTRPGSRPITTSLLQLERLIGGDSVKPGFVEMAQYLSHFIRDEGDAQFTREFVAIVEEGYEKLTDWYRRAGKVWFASGALLECSVILTGVDNGRSLEFRERSADLSAGIQRGRGPDRRAGEPLELIHVARWYGEPGLSRFAQMLLFLCDTVEGTYAGVEATRLLLDCGIGLHRQRVRSYVERLAEALERAGSIHEGCIICTSCAIEVLHSCDVWEEQRFLRCLEWLAHQRAGGWRSRTVDGESGLYGFNYTASAMKAMFVSGLRTAAKEVSDFLLNNAQFDAVKETCQWSGEDVDNYVATGRVAEALDYCNYLPQAVRTGASRLIEGAVRPGAPRMALREYDAWGLIGHIACERSVSATAGTVLERVVSPLDWAHDGSWSGSFYRTAMTGRALAMACESGWRPLKGK